MTDLSFDQSLALSLYRSDEQYPIDLDYAWQWLEYSRKDHCLAAIERNLEEGIDFSRTLGKSTGGRPKQEIRLSIDGFKTLGMLSQTLRGKQIRRYFLDAEKLLKEMISTGQTYEEVRSDCRDMQNPFMNACIIYKFNAVKAHNAITMAVCGKTASELRELDVVDGNANIGLNHIMSPEILANIASVKYHFSSYRKGGIDERIARAQKEITKEKRKSLKPGK